MRFIQLAVNPASFIIGLTLGLLSSCSNVEQTSIETSDIQLFWETYDRVIQAPDTIEQKSIIQHYLKNGSPGLAAICEARRYTVESYLDAINRYPKYWNSLRAKTLEVDKYADGIDAGISKFKSLYPEARPARVYFTIGALRTGGTTLSDKVLIGAEIALADSTVHSDELKDDFPHLIGYFRSNDPEKSIVFNSVHEYVHTQQDTTIGNSLLSWVMIEGVAEFLAVQALGMSSPNEAMIYGRKNEAAVKATFIKEMFNTYEGLWFWANANNRFNIGDLGYFVGASICRRYYENTANKQQAIKDMIELDYHNESELESFIDASGYFDKSMSDLKTQFLKNRPKVTGIEEFDNLSTNVDHSITTMTIRFSERMNPNIRNFRLGPLGEDHLIRITDVVGWSDDGKNLTVRIELQSGLRQQLRVTDVFQSAAGYCLEPYLIDITTR